MPKYDVGDIIKITPIDKASNAWYALITKMDSSRYYYFYFDNGDPDWAAFEGLDSSDRISLHA